MGIDALNSLNSVSQVNNAANVNKLSDATKKQLESYGIDTSQIKTEKDGQLRLQELTSTQQSQQSQQSQQVQGQGQQQNSASANPMDTMTKQAKMLAAEVGADVSSNDNLKTIMTKVFAKLEDMTSTASQNPKELKKLDQYATQFEVICKEYKDYKEQEQLATDFGNSQVNGSLNSMAMYNKLFFNL